METKDDADRSFRELQERIFRLGTSFVDMPKPTYEIQTFGDEYHVVKRFWSGFTEFVSKHFDKEEAEAMRKLAEFSE